MNEFETENQNTKCNWPLRASLVYQLHFRPVSIGHFKCLTRTHSRTNVDMAAIKIPVYTHTAHAFSTLWKNQESWIYKTIWQPEFNVATYPNGEYWFRCTHRFISCVAPECSKNSYRKKIVWHCIVKLQRK